MMELTEDLLDRISVEGMSHIFGGDGEDDDEEQAIDNGANCDDINNGGTCDVINNGTNCSVINNKKNCSVINNKSVCEN